jgi:hypothetical protein
MSHNTPSWAVEEDERAETLISEGKTGNNDAPKLERVNREPSRMQKAFYIQAKYAESFEDLVYKQKKSKGKKAPELAEEAIKMLLIHYGENISML